LTFSFDGAIIKTSKSGGKIMGWLFSQGQTKDELVNRRVKNWENDSEDKEGNKFHAAGKCIAHTLRGNNLWTVWEITKTPIGENVIVESFRYIGLDLLSNDRGYGWGYKDLCESDGPGDVNCPLSYLKMVPVPDSQYAAPWREKVKAYHAEKAQKTKKREKIAVGSHLVLIDGLTVNGMPLKEVTVVAVEPRRIIGSFMGRPVKIAPRYIKEVVAAA